MIHNQKLNLSDFVIFVYGNFVKYQIEIFRAFKSKTLKMGLGLKNCKISNLQIYTHIIYTSRLNICRAHTKLDCSS